VKCIYYDIGCENELCWRDICSHEETNQAKHMRLIYQDSLISKNEVTSLKEEIVVMKQENAKIKIESTEMKQENETLKNKIIQ